MKENIGNLEGLTRTCGSFEFVAFDMKEKFIGNLEGLMRT
jgi:hypothetical protein